MEKLLKTHTAVHEPLISLQCATVLPLPITM